MSAFVDSILNVNPVLALTMVGLLVFAEDALFIGFVIRERQRRSSEALSRAGATWICGR